MENRTGMSVNFARIFVSGLPVPEACFLLTIERIWLLYNASRPDVSWANAVAGPCRLPIMRHFQPCAAFVKKEIFVFDQGTS